MSKKQFTTREKREHKAEKASKEESKANTTAPKVEKVKSKSISVKTRRFDDIDDYDWAGTADDL
jgi:hypothetical protein